MVLDIITAALIVIPMGIGMARGFLHIAVRLLGWIGALVAGFFAAPHLKDYLAESFIGERIHQSLTAYFQGLTMGASEQTQALPMVLGNVIDKTVQNTVDLMVQTMEGVILTVLGFLLTALAIRLLVALVLRPISKRRGKSPVSLMNKVGGLIVGSLEGLLLAFVFLAVLVPVIHISSPETAAAITDNLNQSYLAGMLYDANLLLVIFGI